MSMEAIFWYGFIFFARVCDVTLQTMRLLLIVRGRRFYASLLGFLEVTIYIVALAKVFSSLNDPLSLVAYAGGFAAGNLVGSLVEEKIAVGFLTVQAVPIRCDADVLAEVLRESGFGVTVFPGEGREGPRKVLSVSLERKRLPKLMEILRDNDEEAFITVFDARGTRGGVFMGKKGK